MSHETDATASRWRVGINAFLFVNAYPNREHEERAAAILPEEFPESPQVSRLGDTFSDGARTLL